MGTAMVRTVGKGGVSPERAGWMGTAPVNAKSVIVVSSDVMIRERLRKHLLSMRWSVQEAAGGAEALVRLDEEVPAAVLLDCWLPDLEAGEFARQLRSQFPHTDLLHLDGTPCQGAPRSARRNELLHALREVQQEAPSDGPAWSSAPAGFPSPAAIERRVMQVAVSFTEDRSKPKVAGIAAERTEPLFALPEMVGDTEEMRELGRMVRLVAPRSATVLIEGETGTGKELVAKAVHRLSERASKQFCVLNCAAIPEHLLEAELFGHTRGAFTGAVTSRTGRIEAAHGGTLFLDEIGEMPLGLQAKMLRFLECGELQRIGDNDVSRVDVRIVAATHQHLEERAAEGSFRLDLYHRLSVFPVNVPALRERMEDLPMLVTYMLRRLGEKMPRRLIDESALQRLVSHDWPGNVRELMHVLERAAILSGSRAEIQMEDIRLRASRK